MISLGQLKEIKDLREVWPHEALDFTPWLAEEKNLALLADAVGLEITVDETESKVGDFNVDIYATETGTERRIIIENQLEDTNHDHLGKLITYASGKGADIVIWIVKRAREEHRAAIEWLNNHTDENISFFLIEIKLYKIGNSDPAVKFEIIEKPNDWTKEVKKQSTNAPAQQFRLEYWTAFNEYALHTLAGSIIDGVLRTALLAGVGREQERRVVNHPFIANLETATMVVIADILYKIRSGQCCMVAALL